MEIFGVKPKFCLEHKINTICNKGLDAMVDEWKATAKQLNDEIDNETTWLAAKIRCKKMMDDSKKNYYIATKTRTTCKAHIIVSNHYPRVGVMLIAENLGLSVDFTPDELREFAASALLAADEAESVGKTA